MQVAELHTREINSVIDSLAALQTKMVDELGRSAIVIDFSKAAEDRDRLALVVRMEHRVCGYLVATAMHDRDEHIAVLDVIYVEPEHRRQEGATALANEFESWARARECVAAKVVARVENSTAHDFLEYVGFDVSAVTRTHHYRVLGGNEVLREETSWFAVRCHFQFGADQHEPGDKYCYEERITLWHARNNNHAIELAEAEARTYGIDATYLGACDSFALFEGGFAVNGKEVYSRLRRSPLPPKDYLDRFFFTGYENSDPRWHEMP